MAEIKSAIEIAMERTQGLRLSSVEKERLKEEEVHTRAMPWSTVFGGGPSFPGSGKRTGQMPG